VFFREADGRWAFSRKDERRWTHLLSRSRIAGDRRSCGPLTHYVDGLTEIAHAPIANQRSPKSSWANLFTSILSSET